MVLLIYYSIIVAKSLCFVNSSELFLQFVQMYVTIVMIHC